MPRGGKRPGAGKPKGFQHAKSPTVLEKEAARELTRQLIAMSRSSGVFITTAGPFRVTASCWCCTTTRCVPPVWSFCSTLQATHRM